MVKEARGSLEKSEGRKSNVKDTEIVSELILSWKSLRSKLV